MILIIGGSYSGKRTYLFSREPNAIHQLADGVLDDSPYLCHLQDLSLEQLENPETLLPILLKKRAILCEEVGCGVVPIEPALRHRRELVGRLCILLAQHATEVIRMQAGIPTWIKGEPS